MKSVTKTKPGTYPLLGRRERLSVWEKARGMWKHRKPDPIKELTTMRREWERTKGKNISK
jgi:hypothetical protein